jgi:inner membrane protein
MMGRSHLLLAGASYAALAFHPLETPLGRLTLPVLSGGPIHAGALALALSVGVAAACGLAPDLDKVGSTAARSCGPYTGVLAWCLERSFGHRGALHSLLAVAVAFLIGSSLGSALGVAGLGALVAFGWAAHLATDAWTRQGIPLFWPLSRAHVALPPRLSTGSWVETLVLALSLAGLALYAGGGSALHAAGLP